MFSNKLHFLINCRRVGDNSILNKKCGEPKCILFLEYIHFLVVCTETLIFFCTDYQKIILSYLFTHYSFLFHISFTATFIYNNKIYMYSVKHNNLTEYIYILLLYFSPQHNGTSSIEKKNYTQFVYVNFFLSFFPFFL